MKDCRSLYVLEWRIFGIERSTFICCSVTSPGYKHYQQQSPKKGQRGDYQIGDDDFTSLVKYAGSIDVGG